MLTIVLLPGLDGTGSLFGPFISALDPAVNVQVVRYPSTGALGYEALEKHARGSLPTKGRFVILGESFSGPIAVSIAASRPAGLIGLILCCTFIRNPRPIFGPLRHIAHALPIQLMPLTAISTVLLGRFSTPALRSALAAAMSQLSTEALHARLHAVLSVEACSKLKAVDVPLLYLHATHDPVVPISALRLIECVLPSVQVAPINAPHFLLQVAPNEAAAAVTRFMQSLRDDFS